MKYILSTISWVESIAKKELEKLWIKKIQVSDRMLEFEGDEILMININLWSRVGNKVYQVLSEWKVASFDDLYNLINIFNYKSIYKKNFFILVKAKSINSLLSSEPSIQKISKKAIIDNITNKSNNFLNEDKLNWEIEIFVLIKDNYARILLNTSWEALHKRWYRQDFWEAPIKENLAAALVLLSWWNFSTNLYDLFCWSGTIAIEAAMIAKNIAPSLDRYFAFEQIWLVEKNKVKSCIDLANQQIYKKEYKIIANDIDENILKYARQNALNAGVSDIIEFTNMDFKDFINNKLEWTLVSNPPYWNRLKDDNIASLYKHIDKLFRLNPNLWWWIISSYLDFDNFINLDNYKKRKLYNWWEKAYFYRRINIW